MRNEDFLQLDDETSEMDTVVAVGDFLERRYGIPFEETSRNYGGVVKDLGLSGNPVQDYAALKADREALAERGTRLGKRFNQGPVERVLRTGAAVASEIGYGIAASTVDAAATLPEVKDFGGWRKMRSAADFLRELGDSSRNAYRTDIEFDRSFGGSLTGGAVSLGTMAAMPQTILPMLFNEGTGFIEDIFGKKISEMEGEERGRAEIARTLYAALAAPAEKFGLGKITRGLFRGSVPKKKVLNTLEAMATEGGTEGLQGRLLSGLTKYIAGADVDVFEADTLPRMIQEFVTSDEVLVGATLGGTVRGGLEASEPLVNQLPGRQRAQIEAEMDRALAAFTAVNIPASLKNLREYLDPINGATGTDWKMVDLAYDDAEVRDDFADDPELGEIAVKAKKGDPEAQKEYVERTTVSMDSEMTGAAGVTDAETAAMREAEEAFVGGTDVTSLPEEYYLEQERELDDAVRLAALDDAQAWIESISGEDVIIDRDDNRRVPFMEKVDQMAIDYEWDQNRRDAEVASILQEAAGNMGIPVEQLEANVDKLTALGESTVEFVRGVAQYRTRINKGASLNDLLEEQVEGYAKRYLQEGTATFEEMLAWKHSVEEETGEVTHGDTSRGVTEWLSSQGIAWYYKNMQDQEALGRAPASFTEWVARFIEQLRSIFRQADVLRQLEADGRLDADLKTFLDRALGFDEAFLEARLRDEATETSVQDRESLLDALGGLSGVPRPDMAEGYRGELEQVWEGFGKNWRSYPRKERSLDQIAEALREKGFDMQTPDDVIEALLAVSRGEEVMSEGRFIESGETFSIEFDSEIKAPDEILSSTSVSALTKHPSFKKAKENGDADAAFTLVQKFYKSDISQDVMNSLDPDRPAVIVPVIGREGKKTNAIPIAVAKRLSKDTKIKVSLNVVKINDAKNTGEAGDKRSRKVHEWEGELDTDAQIVLVDDTFTTGQTLVSLGSYLKRDISAVVTLSSGRYGKQFNAEGNLPKLLEKAGITKEDYHELYGKGLTGAQIQQYILNGAKGIEGLLRRFPAKRSQGNNGEAGQVASKRIAEDVSKETFSVGIDEGQLELYFDAENIPDEKRAEARKDIDTAAAYAEAGDLLPETMGGSDLRPGEAENSETNSIDADIRRTRELFREALANHHSFDAWQAALKSGNGSISSIIPELVSDSSVTWNVRGALIRHASHAAALGRILRSPYVETFKVAFVDSEGVVIQSSVMSIGGTTSASADPGMVARELARMMPQDRQAVAGVYLLHNHPSGNPDPSRQDVAVTRIFRQVAEDIGLPILDHVITNGTKYYSFEQNGLLDVRDLPKVKNPSKLNRAEKVREGIEVPEGMLADWEIIPKEELRAIDSPKVVDSLRKSLGKGEFVIYLDRKNNVIGVDQIDMPENATVDRQLKRQVFEGMGRNAATAAVITVSQGSDVVSSSRLRQMREWREFFKSTATYQLLDVIGDDAGGNIYSYNDAGLMEDPAPTFALGFDSDTMAEAPRRRTPEEIKLAQKLKEFRESDRKTDAMREELRTLQVKAVESRKRQRLQDSYMRKIAAEEARRLEQIKLLHEQGEDVTAKLQQLDELRRQLPTAVRHRLGGDIQVSQRKTAMGRQNELNRRIARARELAERHEAMQRKQWLRMTLRRFGTTHGPTLKRLSKEMGKDVRDRLRVALYAAHSDNAEDVLERMQKPEGMPREVFEQTAADFAGLLRADNRNAGKIEAAFFAVQDLIREGKTGMDRFREERAARLEDFSAKAAAVLRRGEGRMNDAEIEQREFERGKGAAALAWVNNALTGTMSGYENVIRRMDGQQEGVIWQELYADLTDGLDAAVNRANTYKMDSGEFLIAAMESAFEGRDYKKVVEMTQKWEKPPAAGVKTGIEFADNAAGPVKDQPLSVSKAISLRLLLKQEGSHATFFEQHKVQDIDALMRAVDDYIGPDGVAYSEQVIAPFFDGAFHALNEVHRRVEGFDLDPVKDYFPFMREVAGAGKTLEEVANPMGGFSDGDTKASINKSNLQSRTETVTHPFRLVSVNTVLQNAVERNANYIGKAGLEKKLRYLSGDPEFRQALAQRFGRQGVKDFFTQAESAIRGRIDPEQYGQWLDRLRGATFVSVLAIKPKIMFTQLTSIPAGMADMPAGEWVDYAARIMANPGQHWRTLRETPAMRGRLNAAQAQETLRELNRVGRLQLNGGVAAKLEQAARYSMFLIKAGDIVGASLSAGPVYFSTYDKAIKAGKSEFEARQEASGAFSRAVNRNQQSPHLHARSAAYQSSSVMRALFQFRSAPMQYNSEAYLALREMLYESKQVKDPAKRKAMRRDAAKKFVIYHWVLPQLFHAIQNAITGFWLDDEDRRLDYWKGVMLAGIFGNFAAYPLWGDIVFATAAKAIDAPYFQPTVAGAHVEKIARVPSHINNAIRFGEPDVQLRALAELGDFSGVPMSQTLKIGESAFEYIDTGDEKELLEIMGWSEFLLGD